jgi:hypothetical protein
MIPLQILQRLRQVSNADEAHETHPIDGGARVDTCEDVGTQHGNSLFDLDVEPDQIHLVQENQ